ncbi:MAG TPA: response regulator transcription factor, partial [Solirubrobacteraceae bacterium]
HRDGIASLLRGDPRLRVVGAVPGRGPAPVERFDVIVLDVTGEDAGGLIRRWSREPARGLVAIGVPDAQERVLSFAEAGVLGFVEREAAVDELVAGIEAAARGEAHCSPRVATTLLRRITALNAPSEPRSDPAALTARERQIVELIAEGLSNKEIASRLYIEVATVKNHVHNILDKLKVSRRGEAAARLRLVEDAPDHGRAAAFP